MKQNIFGFLVPGLALALASAAPAADLYHFARNIPISGAASWDYASVDPDGRRLYVSHGTDVAVIDVDKDTVVGTIANTPGVHGIVAASELGRGVVSCGRENKAAIFDLKTLAVITKLDTGANPDGLCYEPATHEAYLFNGRGRSATVVDVKEGKVVATVALDGKPEFPASDPGLGRIFDNLEDKSAIVAIDTKTHTAVANWPVAPGEGPSGLAIDAKNHRLFSVCGNNHLIMMNAENGKVVADIPIGSGVDAAGFDPGTQLVFASCGGDGVTTIAHEDSPDKLTVVQTLKTEKGARTMALDTKTHKLYEAVGQRGVDGSFKVLVYEMAPQ